MSPSGRIVILVTLCHFAGEVHTNIYHTTEPKLEQSPEAKTYQFNKYIKPEDTVINSPNYPRQYPPDLNLTWELNVSSGQWGLVFSDFDLGIGSDSYGNPDWLEIFDRGGKRVRYTVHVQPLLSYISQGPQLMIQFVSDRFSDRNKRGFQLQVLYGASEREVHMKIIEATKTVKPSEDDTSLTLMVITAVLTLVAFLVVVAAVVLIRKNSQNNRRENRNVFGVRRNSGISHSRRTRSVEETAPNDVPAEQPRRTERAVQRSNSQINWMARAQQTSTMQKNGSSCSNAYTCTKVVTAASVTSQAAVSSLTDFNNHVTRSCESLNEYSETVDSLNCTPGTSRTNHNVDTNNQQPPSYEESRLMPETYQNNEQLQSGLSVCYENLTTNVCKTRQHLATETNIYINTARNSGSRGSINEITIDANRCTIKATRGETPEDRSSISKSAINNDGPTTNIVIYQNVSVNKQSESETNQPSSSSVQIIDGYAFIVPSSDHMVSHNLVSQHATVDRGREAQPLGNNWMTPNATHDDAEAAPEQPSTGACNDIYVNTQEKDRKVNDM
ncbi:unnamed protein product [Candidula unifasciata]|uniref:CUB domain-containing protein n=1 Tax=Candidula unifasciata TaxID=100452 RepID=A0A8S3YP68_9EUPU|nr:unnamed protein product [Candidula unifasciata]